MTDVLTRDQVLESIALGTPIEDVKGPNVDKLVELILNKKALGISFDWQPAALKLTPDERAAEVLKWQDQIKAYESLPVEEKLRLQIRDTFVALHKAIAHCKTNVHEYVENGPPSIEEYQRKINQIHQILDLELISLGNWVPREVRDEIFNRKNKKEGE